LPPVARGQQLFDTSFEQREAVPEVGGHHHASVEGGRSNVTCQGTLDCIRRGGIA
jgi:hypothetical protein